MRKTLRKGISVLLLLLTLVQLLPISPVSAESDNNSYYGEAYLELSEEHRIAYRLIEQGIAGLSPCIIFEGIVSINYVQMVKIMHAVTVDNPQYFWFLEEGKYYFEDVNDGGNITRFEPKYILDGKAVAVGSQELSDAMYAFHTKVQQIVQGIPVNLTTDYEIALYLHDYLAQTVTYTLEGEHPSAYAALIHGEAACYGYSKAYQCLLNAAGIRARTITGNSSDGEGNLSGHAWNQIWLDGDCYYADVTWDDFEEIVHHAYFAVPLSRISRDHFADETFALTPCNHATIDHYRLSMGPGTAVFDHYATAEEAAACFRVEQGTGDSAVFACEIRYLDEDIFSWFNAILPKLSKLLGLSDAAKAYYYDIGDVYYFHLVDWYHQPAQQVTAIAFAEEEICLQGIGRQYILRPQIQTDSPVQPNLRYETDNEAVAVVDENGIIASVGPGSAVITAYGPDDACSAAITVTVEPAQAHVHTMRHFAKALPTCTQDGHETYYLCTDCGRRFADEQASVEFDAIAAFVLPATGHVEYQWVKKFDFHVQECVCGNQKGESQEPHCDENGDLRCDVCDAVMPLTDKAPSQQTDNDSKDSKTTPWIAIAGICVAAVAAIAVFLMIRRRRKGY